MPVATHMKIKLSDSDLRIRTFIPDYDEMLATVADMVQLTGKSRPAVFELGIGTGAPGAQCIGLVSSARLYAIEADLDILALARRRLSRALPSEPKLMQKF